MQNPSTTSAEVQQQVRSAVQEAVQAARQAQAEARAGQAGTPQAPTAPTAPTAPLQPIPVGGGRVIIEQQGDRTVITSAALPPEVLPIAGMVQETALGLVGLLAAMVILGPFARVLARRWDRKADLGTGGGNPQVMQQQLHQLQQSVDAMSLELERISESQRFQSKLLNEGRQGPSSLR
jgi:hypothetical protein